MSGGLDDSTFSEFYAGKRQNSKVEKEMIGIISGKIKHRNVDVLRTHLPQETEGCPAEEPSAHGRVRTGMRRSPGQGPVSMSSE